MDREKLEKIRDSLRAHANGLEELAFELDDVVRGEEPAPEPDPPEPEPPGEPSPPELNVVTDQTFEGDDLPGWLTGAQNGGQLLINDGRARITYPVGLEGGKEPGYVSFESVPASPRRLRVSVRTRISRGFQGHPVVNKWGYLYTGGSKWPLGKVVMQMVGAGQDPIYPTIWLQSVPMEDSPEVLNLRQNINTKPLIRGEWMDWTVEVEQNTGDEANASVRWWLDDILVGEHTGLQFTTAEEPKGWPFVAWRPVWGGRGGRITREQWIECSRILIQGA